MDVLTFSRYYVPAYKGGGPIRTIANLTNHFAGEIRFRIITTDRDFEDSAPFAGMVADAWNEVGPAHVYYTSPHMRSVWRFCNVVRSTPHDVLYLNSFFDPTFTIAPLILRRMRLIPRRPVILAPRGEFSPEALRIRARKKSAYRRLARVLGLYDDIVFQASSAAEADQIRDAMGNHIVVRVAPNLPPVPKHAMYESVPRSRKRPGELRVAFLSRITKMKNLVCATQMLAGVKGRLHFSIFGPIDDISYWRACQGEIRRLPENISVSYEGAIPNDRVVPVLSQFDIFFLPTHGENFGHAILEALLAGCPVLISDRTPWRGLYEKGIGWDLNLGEPQTFTQALQCAMEMDAATHALWSQRARTYALSCLQSEHVIGQSRELFWGVAW